MFRLFDLLHLALTFFPEPHTLNPYIGPEGFEPPSVGLKIRCVAVNTTTLIVVRASSLQPGRAGKMPAPQKITRTGIEPVSRD